MANPLELARGYLAVIEEKTRSPQRDYIGSILSKTAGVDAYKRWQQYAQNAPHISFTDPFTLAVQGDTKLGRKIGGAIVLASQIAFPAGVEALAKMSSYTSKFDTDFLRNYSLALAWGYGEGAIEVTSWGSVMPAVVHNPLEFALYKLAANIVTHVGLDVLEAGINRARGFGPSTPATLAV